ncbi:exosome complex component CSL4 [Ischnura elegans]|uniref:exosome complex component CSL4 n=1 Tax=Ischnura elegans TaxID=197161 RepID=UPI001ED8B1D8|nr:exosome complex component CSL4 [Ischnura elegans]
MAPTNLICVPGQRLCLSNDMHISGCGTYERQGYIYSTLAGEVHVVEKEKSSVIEVHSSNDQSIVPTPGDIVTAMVMMVNPRFSKCTIKCIGDVVLTRPYRAILRREDVRAFEKDSIEMYQCFRPGDIILARVLPTTDIHSYQLSTAENELGVVIAHSEAGIAMVPVSWTEMQCPKTYNKEPRKVAKVVPETIPIDSASKETN